MRAGGRRVQTRATGSPAVDSLIENKWLEKVDGCFHLRDVDVLSEASSAAFEYCRGQSADRVVRRDDVRVRAEGPGGRAVRPASKTVKAGDARAMGTIARKRRPGPGLA